MNSWVWKPMGKVALRVLLAPIFLVTSLKFDNTGEAAYTFIPWNLWVPSVPWVSSTERPNTKDFGIPLPGSEDYHLNAHTMGSSGIWETANLFFAAKCPLAWQEFLPPQRMSSGVARRWNWDWVSVCHRTINASSQRLRQAWIWHPEKRLDTSCRSEIPAVGKSGLTVTKTCMGNTGFPAQDHSASAHKCRLA